MAIEQEAKKRAPARPAGGMGRRRRWLVFGSNVAVMILLATAVAAGAVWLASALLRGRVRADWTAGGRFSLSPRTKALLGELDEANVDVRATNLYAHAPEIPASEEQWRRVRDLLGEYDMASGRVRVEHINPDVDVGGTEQLIRRLTERYAGQLAKPKRLIEAFQTLHQDVQKALQDEAKALGAAADAWADGPPRAVETLRMVSQVWQQLLMIGDFTAGNVRGLSEQALPAYSDALRQAKDYLDQVRERFQVVPEALAKIRDQAGEAEVPEPVQRIIAGAEETYAPLRERIEQFQKDADVGESELDRIRRDIRRGQTILLETFADTGVIVTGDTDEAALRDIALDAGASGVQPRPQAEGYEVLTPPADLEAVRKTLAAADIPVQSAAVERRPDRIQVVAFEDVWPRNPNAGEDPDAPERLFAGEQAVSSVLLGMVQKEKPAVLFVTAGGPATVPMPGPMGRGQPAPYRQMAERLEKANFIVQDWNVQHEREMPQVENASRIVLVLVPPAPPNPQLPVPPPSPESYAPAIEAVRQGAPAILFGEPSSLFQQPVPYADLFSEFGVEAKFNAVAVRSVVVDAAGSEEAIPQLQVTRYADHPITRPVGALPSMVLHGSPLPVAKDLPAGVTVTPLFQIPAGRDYWADTTVIEALQRRATFDAAEDIPGPVPLALAATRQVGDQTQKVVLFGDADFARDYVAFHEGTVLYENRLETQYLFPGNAEIFVNACLWLSGSEHLIAVSPEALEARRIGDLGGWHRPLQVLIIAGLPAIVLGLGILVYVVRRG